MRPFQWPLFSLFSEWPGQGKDMKERENVELLLGWQMSRMGERARVSMSEYIKWRQKLSLERMPTSEVISFAQIPPIPYDSMKRHIAPKVHHIHHNNNTVLYLYWVTLVLVCEENTCFMNEHMSLLRQCHNTQDTTTLMRMYCLVQLLWSMSAA